MIHRARPAYSLMVTAGDKGGLSSSTLVAVNVADVNDNSPLFAPEQYSLTLPAARGELDILHVSPLLNSGSHFMGQRVFATKCLEFQIALKLLCFW